MPLPIFIHKTTKEVLVDDEVNENIASIYEKEGSDCWFSDNPQRFLGSKYKAEDYDKMSDIVEVWFDSGHYQTKPQQYRSSYHNLLPYTCCPKIFVGCLKTNSQNLLFHRCLQYFRLLHHQPKLLWWFYE